MENFDDVGIDILTILLLLLPIRSSIDNFSIEKITILISIMHIRSKKQSSIR